MFDYRYHALSLAAVLCALAVGVLIGVAIGDSSLVSSAKDGIVRNLRSEVRDSQRALEQVGARLSEQETLITDFWPFAVHRLLAEKSIGIVFLGNSSDNIDTLARDAVGEAGGNVNEVVAMREPLDTTGVAAQATGTRYTALASDPSLLRQFGVRIGKQLVGGGQLLERVHTRLFSSYDGQLGKLEGLVVVRSDPAGMSPQAAKSTGEFESGLIAGVASEAVPAVGVELRTTEPSQVSWYKDKGMASVDDLETIAGRAALAFALAGDHGAYGVKPTADALLPSAANPSSQH
ncbi:MAG TPA: copper transporter [Solirubrobacteraceae bacterium]|nr:copper transporter [Solirubrobacteraceae bacterium]